MKSLFVLFVATLAFSVVPAAAQTEVKTDGRVTSVSFDGRILEVGYYVSGGCAEHRGDIEFVIDEANLTVTMNVVDFADKFDPCEALVSGTVKVDIVDKLKKELEARGVHSSGLKLVLPTVTIREF